MSFLHGWQKDDLNIELHAEREVLSYFFTVAPNEFMKWRSETFDKSPAPKYEFPNFRDSTRLNYINKGLAPVWNILLEKNPAAAEKYKPFYDVVMKIKSSLEKKLGK